MVAASELSINTRASAMNMAQTIFGDGVTVVSASYSGDRNSSGTFGDGDDDAPDLTPSDSGVILSTGHVRDVTNSWGQANQNTGTSTNTGGVNNNADFNAIAGANTYDAAWIDVGFIPTTDMLTMQFVFASEEYPEYTLSQFQDMVGVWVNGTHVPLGIGGGVVSPDSLNPNATPNLFLDNTNDAFNTEMDGLTLTLSLKIPVTIGAVNNIRIGIADVGDTVYDSSVLIAANSIQGVLVAHHDVASTSLDGTVDIDVLGNDTGAGVMYITHINGVAVTPGDTVTLATGQDVTLNPDGSLSVTGDGDEESIDFTYAVSDGTHSDTAFVTVDFVPCFVAGTMIETPRGHCPVEMLKPGDLVCTRDNGPQPLRWIGKRSVPGVGKLAPVRIGANSFGVHNEVWVSPMHRILIRDVLAELMFGEAEVLVPARHLVNGSNVIQVDSGEIDYVHLLFDNHEVLRSEGLESESFLPGPQATSAFEAEVLEELRDIFPDVDPRTGEGYGPAARRTLRRFEAELLRLGVEGQAA